MNRFLKKISAGFDRLLLFVHKRRAPLFIGLELFAICALLAGWLAGRSGRSSPAGLFSDGLFSIFRQEENAPPGTMKKDYIKWVDFNVTSEAMTQAFRYDVATCQQEPHLNWVEMLAYLGARYGGDFSRYAPSDMDRLAERLKNGETMVELTKELKHYPYYLNAYGAVLNGMVGYYEIEIPESEAPAFALTDSEIHEGDPSAPAAQNTGDGQEEGNAAGQSDEGASGQAEENGASNESGTENSHGETKVVPLTPDGQRKVWVTKYGLKAFHPLAKNFPYSHYDDFGVSRSYGYRRQHLGHDMMGQTGTPVVAVESGYVEAIGWNQYGGWRLGIRSFDKKRYYYYAHLRKDYPYQGNLKEGSLVTAGDIVGYMGRTGYSANENTNNIDEPHLHFGLQLIFDESQKEGNNEIWIDCYEIIKFLSINRSESVKVDGTKEWTRIYQMKDPSVGTITQ